MRIRTLVLKNFRSHQETVLELDRFNFIRGPNGSGKSSVQMALQYLFTGRCELTDAAGRGAEALIRSGEKELEVSATFQNGETICRRRASRCQIVEINGKRVPVDTAQAALEKRFGPADVLSAVLNAHGFMAMPEAEQKKLLAQVVDAGRIEIPEQIRETLRAVNEEPPRMASVSDVEAAHRRFYDLRTETSRALKALGQMEKPDIPSDLPSVQEVQKKLGELRQQKESLVVQKAEADACWQNAQSRLQQVQAEIEEVSSEILSGSEEQELLQLESQRGEAEKLRQELANLIAEQKTFQNRLAVTQGLKGKCPSCGQSISETVKTRGLETLRERVADLDGLIQGTREELNEYAGIEAAKSRLEGHRKAVSRRAKLLEEQSKLQQVPQPLGEDVGGRLAILTERINKGERVLERARQAQSTIERWESNVRERSSLEARIGLLDQLTEFFGANGAMMKQAAGQMEPFKEKLNRQLAIFGYACNLTLEPFEIRVSSPGGGPVLMLKQLSESERFRFGIAFQIALATATGIRFSVIDRADVLDRARRKVLTALLLSSEIEQAIVLATGEEPPPASVPTGVRFFDLAQTTRSIEAHSLEAPCLQPAQTSASI
jgi:DNA repair exonuclease SbcCD ATPase subunit